MKPTIPFLAVLVLGAPLPLAHAANVSFSTVLGTFQQGGFEVAKSGDGIQDGSGWAVFGGQTANQTAVYRTNGTVAGNEMAFYLSHASGFGEHQINRFRISYTTDAVPGFGSTWTQIAPTSFRSNNGTLANMGSNILDLTGASGATAGYYVTATGSFSGITGYRLETMVGGNGNLGASGNGNFVLSEFGVATDLSINRAMGAVVTTSGPTFGGQPGSSLTDGSTFSVSHPLQTGTLGFSYTVNLQQPIAFSNLELANRVGCCPERLTNFQVDILNGAMAPVWTGTFRTNGSNSGDGGVDNITAGMGVGTFAGQYVRVTNLSGAEYNPQISELRAFGTVIPEPGAFGLAAGVLALGMIRRRR